jgi:hypothetical protein
MMDANTRSPNQLRTARLALFFARQRLLHSEVNQPASGVRPLGYLEHTRAENFQGLRSGMVRIKDNPTLSSLSAQILEISMFALSAVVAFYRSGKVLWLDNHADDEDFEAFLRREGLIEWLPDRWSELLELLCETKLNYLGLPRLIRDVHEIPRPSEESMAIIGKDPRVQAQLAEEAELIASIADQIEPPTVMDLAGDGFELKFTVWTKIYGRLLKLNCRLTTGGGFQFEGSELAKLVGAGIVPR